MIELPSSSSIIAATIQQCCSLRKPPKQRGTTEYSNMALPSQIQLSTCQRLHTKNSLSKTLALSNRYGKTAPTRRRVLFTDRKEVPAHSRNTWLKDEPSHRYVCINRSFQVTPRLFVGSCPSVLGRIRITTGRDTYCLATSHQVPGILSTMTTTSSSSRVCR